MDSAATVGLIRSPLDTAYEAMMIGSDTSVADCCAATVDLTRADTHRITLSATARNGGITKRMSSHQPAVGKNHPPTSGPTRTLTITE